MHYNLFIWREFHPSTWQPLPTVCLEGISSINRATIKYCMWASTVSAMRKLFHVMTVRVGRYKNMTKKGLKNGGRPGLLQWWFLSHRWLLLQHAPVPVTYAWSKKISTAALHSTLYFVLFFHFKMQKERFIDISLLKTAMDLPPIRLELHKVS
jgi:hypothetical protein